MLGVRLALPSIDLSVSDRTRQNHLQAPFSDVPFGENELGLSCMWWSLARCPFNFRRAQARRFGGILITGSRGCEPAERAEAASEGPEVQTTVAFGTRAFWPT